jgi:hypothetical protein
MTLPATIKSTNQSERAHPGVSRAEHRVRLVARLRMNRSQIAAAILARVRLALADPQRHETAIWSAAQSAVHAYVDMSMEMLEHGTTRVPPTPPGAADLYRQAALAGASLASLLRCFTIGAAELWEAVIQATDEDAMTAHRTQLLHEALLVQTALLDRLLQRMAHAYVRTVVHERSPRDQRRARQVQRVLVGARFDPDELDYELDRWHLGLVVCGPPATTLLRDAAVRLGCQLLTVQRSDTTMWAWLRSRRDVAPVELERLLSRGVAGACLAIGEPACGIEGFRLTHRQARAALSVAERMPQPLTRYADVALLAAALQDDALAESLVSLYLSPLGDEHDGGPALQETLRAYFAAGRNASAAAAALGIGRRTISNRLRKIEQRLGRLLDTRQAELEVALRLAALQEPAGPQELDAHVGHAEVGDLPLLA